MLEIVTDERIESSFIIQKRHKADVIMELDDWTSYNGLVYAEECQAQEAAEKVRNVYQNYDFRVVNKRTVISSVIEVCDEQREND